MDKFYTIRELSQPREIYSDPFMQSVRDKTDLLALARKCMEGFEEAFGDLFSSVQDDISKRTDTGDIFDVDYLWLYLLDEGNQFVRCDGAYIRNLEDFHLDPNYFWAMVKLDGSATAKERFNDEDWEHNPTFYDEAVQELAEAEKHNAYITILDIHV